MLKQQVVRFIAPDHEDDSSQDPDPDSDIESGIRQSSTAEISSFTSNNHPNFEVDHNPTPSSTQDWASPHQVVFQNTPIHSSLQQNSLDPHVSASACVSADFSPAQSAGQPFSAHPSSPVLHHASSNTASPNYGLNPAWPFKSLHEARLLHHYIVHLSLQFDSCDKQCHFGKEIPKRAAHYPVIKYAIFAVSSRQMSLLAGTEDNESPQYVSECLRILIAALEDPMGHFDENLLAAIILLRTHEEMSDNDERCHLFGTTRLLNSIASFAADGGLRESASWVSLRQHIYISLTSQHPLTINLTNYRHSHVFQTSDDESWANRIIFIFARILTYIFRPEDDSEQLSLEQWTELDAEVTTWASTKPWHFTPLFMETVATASPSISMPSPERKTMPWPELFVCNPAQVVGLQHYYLAKIVLAVYDPRLSRLGFDSIRFRRTSEDIVRENLRMVIGLAASNEQVATAMFQASHILAACGMYLNNQEEQDAAVDFLMKMNARMGWQTSHIIRDLKEHWGWGQI
ncbi:uncharacterized protein Z518_01310 [Rhinocladiella mackenziei CBS 650.93]|uniref:Zn(II)2Cys6 transcription factor n=1 Tax=Rhinocladiella mackenziei CBS 650.93 TaxID=1442369 RepID=A0A0D2IW08_9EURO|nr:uncharacterized protein Z518_01310 [Rhinocladiella mackenziei CBS 650.93]KIX10229.1 hypothetical protein Z518_01310 [Rhinocladiella mackenziei CBS 650.93]